MQKFSFLQSILYDVRYTDQGAWDKQKQKLLFLKQIWRHGQYGYKNSISEGCYTADSQQSGNKFHLCEQQTIYFIRIKNDFLSCFSIRAFLVCWCTWPVVLATVLVRSNNEYSRHLHIDSGQWDTRVERRSSGKFGNTLLQGCRTPTKMCWKCVSHAKRPAWSVELYTLAHAPFALHIRRTGMAWVLLVICAHQTANDNHVF